MASASSTLSVSFWSSGHDWCLERCNVAVTTFLRVLLALCPLKLGPASLPALFRGNFQGRGRAHHEGNAACVTDVDDTYVCVEGFDSFNDVFNVIYSTHANAIQMKRRSQLVKRHSFIRINRSLQNSREE
jgi:hypothetical protein